MSQSDLILDVFKHPVANYFPYFYWFCELYFIQFICLGIKYARELMDVITILKFLRFCEDQTWFDIDKDLVDDNYIMLDIRM